MRSHSDKAHPSAMLFEDSAEHMEDLPLEKKTQPRQTSQS